MNKIIEELTDLPNQIKEKELKILELQEKKDNAEKSLKYIENAILLEIAMEKDKDRLKNAETRNAELQQRLNSNQAFRTSEIALKQAIKSHTEAKIDFSLLMNKQGNLRGISRIFGGRIAKYCDNIRLFWNKNMER